MNIVTRRCWSGAAGLVADSLLGEPPAPLHPVAAFGRAMTVLEQYLWRDSRQFGVAYSLAGVAVGIVSGWVIKSTLLAVLLAVAGRELRRIGRQIEQVTVAGDLQVARDKLPALVGRDPSELDSSGIASAVIESVAENTVDAVVAPVFWGVVGGAPGACAYRAVNTMDAMVGHKSERFLRFGWASARLDDVANYLPARLFAVLVVLAAPKRQAEIRRSIQETAAAHPSPNAGVAEAAVAGAIGVQLGGPLRYGQRVENRPFLGRGLRPNSDDIEPAIKVTQDTERILAVALMAVGLIGWIKEQCE